MRPYIIYFQIYVKTHSSVSCSPKKWGACKQSEYIDRTKLWFSRICSSVMLYQNDNKFTVELASTRGWPHSKFEKILQAVHEILVKDTKCEQTFLYVFFHHHFAHFAKITTTIKLYYNIMNWKHNTFYSYRLDTVTSWNLWGPGAFSFVSIHFGQIRSMFSRLQKHSSLTWYSLSTLEGMDVSLAQKVSLDLFSPSQENLHKNAYCVASLMLLLQNLTIVLS